MPTVFRIPLWRSDINLLLHSNGLHGKAPRVTKLGQTADTPYATFDHATVQRARSIQSLVAHDSLKPPDVMKIDVEGAGLAVLQGMGTIRPRSIFLEVHPLYSDQEPKSEQYLHALGYITLGREKRGRQLLFRFEHAR